MKDGFSLDCVDGPEREKRASPVVSVPTFFVGMVDESPVIVKDDIEGMDICVVSAVMCEPV